MRSTGEMKRDASREDAKAPLHHKNPLLPMQSADQHPKTTHPDGNSRPQREGCAAIDGLDTSQLDQGQYTATENRAEAGALQAHGLSGKEACVEAESHS